MNISILFNLLNEISKDTSYSKFISKTWIYKQKICVIEFEHKKINFALDFSINELGKIKINLVNRNAGLVYLLNKTNNNKTKLVSDIELGDVEFNISQILKKIIEKIDAEFAYSISIVVPVYNREKLILKCIESLNNQTLSKECFEVIFVDDCSTDNTIAAIENFCLDTLNYTILKRPIGSGNACAPRNDGIKKSKGRYIFFLDSDDYIAEDCLEKSLKFAEECQSDVTYIKIVSDTENPRKHSIPVRPFKKGSIAKADITKNHLMRSNASFKFYKREFILKNRFIFDQSLPLREDKLFNLQILSRTNKVSILADKDYIFVTAHDGEHLSRVQHDILSEVILYLNGYNWIYTSDLENNHLEKLFNAWTLLICERLISIVKSNKINEKDKIKFFERALVNARLDIHQLNESMFYKHLKKYIPSIVKKNYLEFKKVVFEI